LTCVREAIIYNQMVVRQAERTDLVFHALADATRRDIVERSMRGTHSVSALAEKYAMSFAAVQKHVAVLERAGLVSKERRGREQLVRTNVEAIRHAQRLLDRWEAVWRDRMDRFGEVLAQAAEEQG
jgi:DNA-binding transcriptional ArsR family regulator